MENVRQKFLVISLILVSSVSFAVSTPATGSGAKEKAIEAVTEIFFKRNPAAVDAYVVEDYIQHQPGLKNGRAPFKEYLSALFKAFPDYQGEIESVVAEGDLVSFHFRWTGTHKGEFLGTKPTGKKIVRRTADVMRMRGNKIVEHWGVVDQLDMLIELGKLSQSPK